MPRKVIITCAVTGAIHTPSMSPHLPVTAKEIADAALGAAKAGASIVHLHARNPVDGSPSQDPELFTPFLKEIKEKSNVVINLTTGGAPTMTIADRLAPCAPLQARSRLIEYGFDELWFVRHAQALQNIQA
jgi:uncharacterized protein (DUF849 family)